MAKSKCYLCNKHLRGGEGMLKQLADDNNDDYVVCENYIKDVSIFTAAACVGMAVAAVLMYCIYFM